VPKYSLEGSHLPVLGFKLHIQLRSVILSQHSPTNRNKAFSQSPKLRVEMIIADEEQHINKILPVNSLKEFATACTLLQSSDI